jgi:hypothetical protein
VCYIAIQLSDVDLLRAHLRHVSHVSKAAARYSIQNKIYIGVVSVISQYNCVYYGDTCY